MPGADLRFPVARLTAAAPGFLPLPYAGCGEPALHRNPLDTAARGTDERGKRVDWGMRGLGFPGGGGKVLVLAAAHRGRRAGGTTPVEDVVLGQREEAAAHQPMVQILCVFSFVKMMARYAYICMVLIL